MAIYSQGPKVFYDEQALSRTATRLAFSFPTNGSSSPVAAKLQGRGVASVVRTATGLFTVTLQDFWNKLLSGVAHLQLATPAKQMAVIKATVTPSSALTFTLETLDTSSGAAVDVAAAAGNNVNCLLILSNSSFGAGL
jgi:hypothetical protein